MGLETTFPMLALFAFGGTACAALPLPHIPGIASELADSAWHVSHRMADLVFQFVPRQFTKLPKSGHFSQRVDEVADDSAAGMTSRRRMTSAYYSYTCVAKITVTSTLGTIKYPGEYELASEDQFFFHRNWYQGTYVLDASMFASRPVYRMKRSYSGYDHRRNYAMCIYYLAVPSQSRGIPNGPAATHAWNIDYCHLSDYNRNFGRSNADESSSPTECPTDAAAQG